MTVVDDRQVQPPVGGNGRLEVLHERDQWPAEGIVVESNTAAELQEVAQENCGDVHSDAPRKRIRPLIVSSISRSGKALSPMIAARTDLGEEFLGRVNSTVRRFGDRPESGSLGRGSGSVAVVASLRAADGFVDDLASDHDQLVMLVLAQRAQPSQRLVLGAAGAAHENAHRSVDDAPRLQC